MSLTSLRCRFEQPLNTVKYATSSFRAEVGAFDRFGVLFAWLSAGQTVIFNGLLGILTQSKRVKDLHLNRARLYVAVRRDFVTHYRCLVCCLLKLDLLLTLVAGRIHNYSAGFLKALAASHALDERIGCQWERHRLCSRLRGHEESLDRARLIRQH